MTGESLFYKTSALYIYQIKYTLCNIFNPDVTSQWVFTVTALDNALDISFETLLTQVNAMSLTVIRLV